MPPIRLHAALLAGLLLGVRSLAAGVIDAGPADYRDRLRRLRPGDTLRLSEGVYRRLPVIGLNGTPDAWIVIQGSPAGNPPTIIGEDGYNTVEVRDSSYVAIENLTIDSRGIPGCFGIAAHGGEGSRTHHIRVEGNSFVGQNGGQQTVAISTKTPTWGWIVRFNRIAGAGTGLYLGNSDGSQPFVEGLIENNLVRDTTGYNMEIKHQNSLPDIPGMPATPAATVIRHNVFLKDDRPSPDGDRPNVLLDPFPQTGRGALNMYEVYGNVFVHNRREALLQAAGRVSVHDNLFVDGPDSYPAVVFEAHNGPVKIAYFFNNTVYTSGKGVYFGQRPAVDDAVTGNLVFASAPFSGPIRRLADNLTDTVANAARYVRLPSRDLGTMDFHPRSGSCAGSPIDLTPFRASPGYGVDFDGQSKVRQRGAAVCRGAYASDSGTGWQVAAAIKPPHPPAPPEPPAPLR